MVYCFFLSKFSILSPCVSHCVFLDYQHYAILFSFSNLNWYFTQFLIKILILNFFLNFLCQLLPTTAPVTQVLYVHSPRFMLRLNLVFLAQYDFLSWIESVTFPPGLIWWDTLVFCALIVFAHLQFNCSIVTVDTEYCLITQRVHNISLQERALVSGS